jgi:[citrate (pro-3S)-lyase] ligase
MQINWIFDENFWTKSSDNDCVTFSPKELTGNHWCELPLEQIIEKGKTYSFFARVKYATASKLIVFRVVNSAQPRKWQNIWVEHNPKNDEWHNVLVSFTANDNYERFLIVSPDFTPREGRVYITFDSVQIQVVKSITQVAYEYKITSKKSIGLMARIAAQKKNLSSLFEFFYDKNIPSVSLYINCPDMLDILAMVCEEQLFPIYKVITSNKESFSWRGVTSVNIDNITEYDSNIPIIITDDICPQSEYVKLSEKSKDVYKLYDVLNYAIYKGEILEPLKNRLSELQVNANIMIVYAGAANDVKDKSDWEKKLCGIISASKSEIVAERDKVVFDYFPNYHKEVLAAYPWNLLKFRKVNGKILADDIDNKWLTINNGFRTTVGNSTEYENNIWVFGDSRGLGWGNINEDTIQSKLQGIVNKELPNRYNVHNVVTRGAGSTSSYFDSIYRCAIKDNDILIVIYDVHPYFNNHGFLTNYCDDILFLDERTVIQRPHDQGEIFYDLLHMNGRGNLLYAKAIYDTLKANGIFDKENREKMPPVKQAAEKIAPPPKELSPWLDELSKHKKRIGSIVMNCNPFTLGHRYLIEYASKKCDFLYIFVVEEDKSVFKFEDRIELVKKGTVDLSNVTVLPSGKFIISSYTFGLYFDKAEKQNENVDASLDVELFAQHIAPALGITIRFAGEEPLDNITRQYNDTIKRILPQHWIEFCVIPRKEADGAPISASRVRALLKEQNFAEIAKIVPETTLGYLRWKYGG